MPLREADGAPGGHLLVTLADANGVDQAKQVFASAYLSGQWDGQYLLLAHRIPEQTLLWFRQRGVLVREYDLPLAQELWDQARADPRLSSVSLLKYYLFGPDFRSWATVLYLDGDVIVAGLLGGLGAVRRFAAVPEMALELWGQFRDSARTRRLLRTAHDLRRDSFNFGVFALRPSSIQTSVFPSLCRLSEEWFAHSVYLEQSVANLCFYSGWERLPYRLNYNPVLGNRFGIRFPAPFRPMHVRELIYHFYGQYKPWHRGHPFRALWLRNLRLAEDISDFRRPGPPRRLERHGELESLVLELVIQVKLRTRRLRRLRSRIMRHSDA